MIEKRFKLIDGIKKGTHSGIWDNQKQHNQGIGDELWLGEVVGMLNEGVILAEENKKLKTQLSEFDFLQNENQHMRTVLNENKQLKQYIYDNLDEDICDVCSYQYLEKSQMDKYYIAKCKKGYDNCSKGTVIHCKDFKFKELEE